jgi:hypothetical protein
MTYSVEQYEDGTQYIKRINADNSVSFIPMTEENADYREYLKSLDETSTL